MRIAYLSGAEIPSAGANSVHVMRMCQAFGRLGHDVTLFARPGRSDDCDDHSFYGVEKNFAILKVRRPPIRLFGALICALRVRRNVLVNRPYDLIYARDFWALWLLREIGIPMIFESHWQPKSCLHAFVENGIFRSRTFRRVVFISEALRRIYLQGFPCLDRHHTMVAHDAADVEVDEFGGPSIELGRHGVLQLGYVGSFWPGYGIDTVEVLAKRMTDVDFHVVGGRSSEVAERSARTQGSENLWFHGFIQPSRLVPFYNSFDAMLAPYQRETPHIDWISPMKLFEYMAHGKAIVCSDFPVLREIINDEENGLLVPSDDLEAWEAAIRRLEDPMERERLGFAARRRLEEEFTWEKRADRVLSGLEGSEGIRCGVAD